MTTDREALQQIKTIVDAQLAPAVAIETGPLVTEKPLDPPALGLAPTGPVALVQDLPAPGSPVSKTFDFQQGVVYPFRIPMGSNWSVAPGGEGVYPEGLDADMCISLVPGDMTHNPPVSGGFGGVTIHPYTGKASNGNGLSWRSYPGPQAAITPNEQWYFNFRSNNKSGSCYLQTTRQG